MYVKHKACGVYPFLRPHERHNRKLFVEISLIEEGLNLRESLRGLVLIRVTTVYISNIQTKLARFTVLGKRHEGKS